MAGKERARGGGKILSQHVGQRIIVQHIVATSRAQQLQEIDPTLAVGAREVGEPFIADVGAVAVVALMACGGVVDVDVAGQFQAHPQQGLFLRVEVLIDLGDDGTELARRDIDAPLTQLLQQQGLCDVGVVVLIEDVGDESGTVVAPA